MGSDIRRCITCTAAQGWLRKLPANAIPPQEPFLQLTQVNSIIQQQEGKH